MDKITNDREFALFLKHFMSLYSRDLQLKPDVILDTPVLNQEYGKNGSLESIKYNPDGKGTSLFSESEAILLSTQEYKLIFSVGLIVFKLMFKSGTPEQGTEDKRVWKFPADSELQYFKTDPRHITLIKNQITNFLNDEVLELAAMNLGNIHGGLLLIEELKNHLFTTESKPSVNTLVNKTKVSFDSIIKTISFLNKGDRDRQLVLKSSTLSRRIYGLDYDFTFLVTCNETDSLSLYREDLTNRSIKFKSEIVSMDKLKDNYAAICFADNSLKIINILNNVTYKSFPFEKPLHYITYLRNTDLLFGEAESLGKLGIIDYANCTINSLPKLNGFIRTAFIINEDYLILAGQKVHCVNLKNFTQVTVNIPENSDKNCNIETHAFSKHHNPNVFYTGGDKFISWNFSFTKSEEGKDLLSLTPTLLNERKSIYTMKVLYNKFLFVGFKFGDSIKIRSLDNVNNVFMTIKNPEFCRISSFISNSRNDFIVATGNKLYVYGTADLLEKKRIEVSTWVHCFN